MQVVVRICAMLLLVVSIPAYAAPLNGINNASFIEPSASELRLEPYAANVLVEKFGRCRYLTSQTADATFVPLGSNTDFDSFIANAGQVAALRLCREEHAVTWDYTASSLPASQRLSSDFVRQIIGFEQWSELSADRSDFTVRYDYSRDVSADLAEAKSLAVTYTRLDCRINRNANGTLRSDPTVCNAASWVETGKMAVNYFASSDSPHLPNAAPGDWTESADAKSSTAVPPVNIPAQRACGLFAHNHKRWLLTGTGNTRLPNSSECPFGAGSATISFAREGEYLCFDGIEARTGTAEREVNATLNGSCDPAPAFTLCPTGQAARWGTGNCVPYSAAAIVDAEPSPT